MGSNPSVNSSSPASPTDEKSNLKLEKEKPRQESRSVEGKRPKTESDPSRSRQSTNGLSCTKMLGKCGVACAANTGRPDCASTICVRLQQECLSTGCWRGKAFSSCGLIRQ
jgi:hypothetical protein